MKFSTNSYLFVFLILISSISFPQSIETLWTKTFGGTNIDVGYSLKQTQDGGYIIVGYTRSFGTMSGRNIWLVKTDAMGNEVWNKALGGDADDEAYSIQQTSDKGYILTGYTKSMGMGLMDVVLYKTDSLGNEIWNRTFGGSNDEEGYSVLQTDDGGYIIAGATSSFGTLGSRDVWVIKTDANGTDIWKKNYGGNSSDGARNIQKTSDGGYIITGWTFLGPGYIGNALLLKIDSLGNQQWLKYFGGDDADRGYCVQQTSDGGYILTGYTSCFGAGLDDMWLIKTNSQGVEEWNKTFGGTGRDYGNWIEITSDKGYLITGYTLSFGAGGDDVWLIKTDSLGNKILDKTYGGTASDVGYCGIQSTDGSYVITGHTLSYGTGVHDVWLLKTALVLPVELSSFTAITNNDDVELLWSTATETNNKGFEVQRKSGSNDWTTLSFIEGRGTSTQKNNYSFLDKRLSEGKYSFRLKQTDFNGQFEYSNTIEVEVGEPSEFTLSQNYPNPFNPTTSIKYSVPFENKVSIKVFDVMGKEIMSLVNEVKPVGNYEVQFDASSFSAGTYFYQMTSGNFVSTKKLILIK
ncbi:MAG TPA: T9SS type A sorting domain-containing protein [Ignavibacteriaceae bacterium]|nr:T9SS type A sorting domain-containing protein [Ignavibacteriaceae bacterium]